VNYAVYALVLHMLGYTGLIAPLAVAAGSIAGLGVNFTAARHLVFAPRR
jgi:putative flippase GtrA